MSILIQAKKIARHIRRALGVSPIQRVLGKLIAQGINISEAHALEVFGCNGDGHSKDYARKVASLEVWDIAPTHESGLRENLPMAIVKICDSYNEIRITGRKYGLIVIDNSPIYPPYIEHFDLFPHVLDIADSKLVLIINIIPEINRTVVRMYPKMLDAEVLERRKSFYGVEDPQLIPIENMIAKYREDFELKGFVVERYFTQRRNKMLHYLVLMAARSLRSIRVHGAKDQMGSLTSSRLQAELPHYRKEFSQQPVL